uniref:DHHA2 domain-containing protein n=1 Tax=Amblyomma maculatum TaxID=34609 RepID=G3MLY9_AMBMU
MDRFLLECKRNLEKLDSFTKVHVVLGNESCDLDSAVSAIVTAYLLHELQPVTSLLVVPVLNVARKDVRLRTEVTYFFEQVEIPLDSLVCRDEIDLKRLHSQSKLSLTLVDHNLLPKEDADLQGAVQEIIDHHRLETSHRCDKTVEMVGSCCTLVAEKLLHSKPELASPQVALLLYGTILLDTVCLSESARKTTAKDLEMVSRLQALLPELNKEEVFKPLCRAKSNVDGLCLDELLRKDLKVVCSSAKRIAISSVPGEIKSICQENTMEAELGKFCETHGYSALIILTIAVEEKSNSVQRQLAVFSSDIMLKQQLTSTLLAVGEPSLDLQVSHMSTDHLITFVQGNAQASRKVVLPVVRKFLSTLVPSTRRPTLLSSGPFFNQQPPRRSLASFCVVPLGRQTLPKSVAPAVIIASRRILGQYISPAWHLARFRARSGPLNMAVAVSLIVAWQVHKRLAAVR